MTTDTTPTPATPATTGSTTGSATTPSSHAATLPMRRLGDLDVPAIGYGAMVLSPGMYGEIDDERAARALHHAIDAGATFVDSSDGYGVDGHNESLIGRVLAERSADDVVVATKFGFNLVDGAEPHPFPVGFEFGELAVNAEPRFVRAYAEASLRRLGRDHIDLYYPHFPDPQVPIEETVGAIAELIEAGLVRHIGLSNVDADQLARAATVAPIAAVQAEWSMWAPVDSDLLAVARRESIGVVAWSPLGSGFLTGTVTEIDGDDFRNNAPRFTGDRLATNRDRFAPVADIARSLDLSPSQLALAWLLHQDPDVVPIPGSRTPAHIDENLAAASIGLHADTLTAIDLALAAADFTGDRLL